MLANHSGAARYVNTQAPITKSSWSTRGNEAPLLRPILRLKKLLNISPKSAPHARARTTIKATDKIRAKTRHFDSQNLKSS